MGIFSHTKKVKPCDCAEVMDGLVAWVVVWPGGVEVFDDTERES